MKKKLLCGILAMALACSLYGCGSSGAATTVPPNTTEAAGGDTRQVPLLRIYRK